MYELGDIHDQRSGRVYLHEAIGKDSSVLKQLSPTHNADKIKIPVMLAHGEEDERAPIEHALAMKKALEINGIECKWMVKPKESHGFFTKSNQVEFYSHLVKFLRKHIQPERFTARQIIDVHAAAKFGKADLAKALKHTKNNREEVRNSRQCGCYFCSHIFSPSEIKEYKDGNSAVCPKCGTDSVIGSASGYPITSAFLKKLREYWLSKD
jgi:hypothetical protein